MQIANVWAEMKRTSGDLSQGELRLNEIAFLAGCSAMADHLLQSPATVEANAISGREYVDFRMNELQLSVGTQN